MAKLRCKLCGDVFDGEEGDVQGYDHCPAHAKLTPVAHEGVDAIHDPDDPEHPSNKD